MACPEGLREGDLGGAGFIRSRACQRAASASELNAVISAHALPFLVVDEEGSEEY
jgi:hypothetical protein